MPSGCRYAGLFRDVYHVGDPWGKLGYEAMKVAQAIQPSCHVTCVKPIIFSMGCPHWFLKLALGFTKRFISLLIILLVGHNWTIMWLVYNCQQQDAVSVDRWADDRKDVHVHVHIQDIRVLCDAENGPWRIVRMWRIINQTLYISVF